MLHLMKRQRTSCFENWHMARCLLGQAHLCEQIASACWSEEAAKLFRERARKCKEAATKLDQEMASAWVGGLRRQ
jgi:hypothetical protein